MDDFILLLKDKESCILIKENISNFLKENLHLELNHKSKYYPNKMGVDFCGYRIFATHRLLRNSSKKRIKRHVKKWNKSYKNRTLNIPLTVQRINSWLGHSSYCNSYTLQQKVLGKCDFLYNNSAFSKIQNQLVEDMKNIKPEV